MSVLLSEVDVPYSACITEVDEANELMPRADVALVVGANDTVNTDAVNEPTSALYGTPIIRVDLAQRCVVMKRSTAAGFVGVENPLFFHERTSMLFGDAFPPAPRRRASDMMRHRTALVSAHSALRSNRGARSA